ncbi:hypothetical protein BHE74_00007997 [Ensete ventricosum]|nr:hypothetical protein BHE74_00007997 [Ensete ventricosum]
MSGSLLYRSSGIRFACRGAIASRGRFVALLCVMAIVEVEAIVTPSVSLLQLGFHRVGRPEEFPKGWAPLMGYNEDIYTCGVEIGVVPRCLIGMEPLAIKQVSFCVGRCLRRFPGPHSRLSTVSTVYWVDDTT